MLTFSHPGLATLTSHPRQEITNSCMTSDKACNTLHGKNTTHVQVSMLHRAVIWPADHVETFSST